MLVRLFIVPQAIVRRNIDSLETQNIHCRDESEVKYLYSIT
jgi:hypothetical protein